MLIRCIVLLFIWSASAQDLEQEFAEKDKSQLELDGRLKGRDRQLGPNLQSVRDFAEQLQTLKEMPSDSIGLNSGLKDQRKSHLFDRFQIQFIDSFSNPNKEDNISDQENAAIGKSWSELQKLLSERLNKNEEKGIPENSLEVPAANLEESDYLNMPKRNNQDLQNLNLEPELDPVASILEGMEQPTNPPALDINISGEIISGNNSRHNEKQEEEENKEKSKIKEYIKEIQYHVIPENKPKLDNIFKEEKRYVYHPKYSHLENGDRDYVESLHPSQIPTDKEDMQHREHHTKYPDNQAQELNDSNENNYHIGKQKEKLVDDIRNRLEEDSHENLQHQDHNTNYFDNQAQVPNGSHENNFHVGEQKEKMKDNIRNRLKEDSHENLKVPEYHHHSNKFSNNNKASSEWKERGHNSNENTIEHPKVVEHLEDRKDMNDYRVSTPPVISHSELSTQVTEFEINISDEMLPQNNLEHLKAPVTSQPLKEKEKMEEYIKEIQYIIPESKSNRDNNAKEEKRFVYHPKYPEDERSYERTLPIAYQEADKKDMNLTDASENGNDEDTDSSPNNVSPQSIIPKDVADMLHNEDKLKNRTSNKKPKEFHLDSANKEILEDYKTNTKERIQEEIEKSELIDNQSTSLMKPIKIENEAKRDDIKQDNQTNLLLLSKHTVNKSVNDDIKLIKSIKDQTNGLKLEGPDYSINDDNEKIFETKSKNTKNTESIEEIFSNEKDDSDDSSDSDEKDLKDSTKDESDESNETESEVEEEDDKVPVTESVQTTTRKQRESVEIDDKNHSTTYTEIVQGHDYSVGSEESETEVLNVDKLNVLGLQTPSPKEIRYHLLQNHEEGDSNEVQDMYQTMHSSNHGDDNSTSYSKKLTMYDELYANSSHLACIDRTVEDVMPSPDDDSFSSEHGLNSANFGYLLEYIAGNNDKGEKKTLAYPVLIQVTPHINETVTRSICLIISQFNDRIPPEMEHHLATMDLAKPNNPEIRLRTVGAKIWYARMYSGTANEYTYRQQARNILDIIVSDDNYLEVDLHSYTIGISKENDEFSYTVGFQKLAKIN